MPDSHCTQDIESAPQDCPSGERVAGQDATVHIHDSGNGETIPAEIYGQFSEHLGRCIYGGLWVGKDSPIPNIDGYRKDVFEALKALKIPVMRWPGGCFGDVYHWMAGIEVTLPPCSIVAFEVE